MSNTMEDCPRCKAAKRKGKLIIREGSHGKFYGCTNFPACRYTERISQVDDEPNEFYDMNYDMPEPF